MTVKKKNNINGSASLPKEWEEMSLGEIATFINGRAYKQNELLESGKYKVLRVGNLFTNNNWYYSDLELEEDKYVFNGDLMYAWSASFGPRYWKEEKTIYHYHIWKVVQSKFITKEFLFHFLAYDTEKIFNQKQGGTMFHITKGDIEKRKICLPPLTEQREIASILNTCDRAISLTEQLILKKETQKGALMEQLLTGKKRLKGFKQKWETKKLEQVSDKIGDGLHGTPNYVEASEYYFVNGNNLVDNTVKFLSKAKCVSKEEFNLYRKDLNSNTILLSINGTVGSLAFYNGEKIILGKSVAYINCSKGYDKLFLFYFLESEIAQSYFKGELTGSTISNLSLKTIRNTPVPVPSLQEQEKIASVLSTCDKEIQLLKSDLAYLKQQKQGVMHILLTGKKRVKI